MNRIIKKLREDKKILSIYFTAGYPTLDATVPVIEALQASGVDMIEIGLPFSDPLADGPTIQHSGTVALKNGMNTDRLFEQLKTVRDRVRIPLVIMGYFNPVMQYGVSDFCAKCQMVGVDGVIIPDLPVAVYQQQYRPVFSAYGLLAMFLITPQTPEKRIRFIDSVSEGFIYMVSSASITGAKAAFDPVQRAYFKRVAAMQLNTPQMVGFGISNAATFKAATAHAKGAIIGSAFITHLAEKGIQGIGDFVASIQS